MTVLRTETTISNFRAFDRSTLDTVTEIFPVNTLSSKISSNSAANVPLVAVLLCTHHGGRFLAEQLDSIRAQDHQNLTIWVSDDGSKDNTHLILKQFQSLWGKSRFSIHSGPQKGFVANFLSLICHSDIKADYFAYADQDDIWEPEKLSRAIGQLENVPKETPALYCARTRLIDERGRETGFSPLFDKPPSFANALVQSIGGGNTMVMNKAAQKILRAAGERTVVSHDWWAYMLISAAGGTVIYDPYPTVRYRQHNNNLVGANIGWYTRLIRMRQLFKGRFQNWNTINTQALQQVRDSLVPEYQRTLDEFCTARNRWLMPRIWGIKKSGVYRQTMMGNLGLIAATVLKKL